MKKRTKTIIIIVVTLILISNLPPVTYFLQESYSYQNKDGSFKYFEENGKGLDFEVGAIRFNRFLDEHPSNPNKTLYRNFTFKPWRFWEWGEMIFNSKRYGLPYFKK